MSYQAAVTSPHHLASKAGEAILNQGGNAIEACIAIASTLTVVYPHMTSLGGDGFWLIHKPGEKPIALNAAGKAARDLRRMGFGEHLRGPNVALTTAGVVSGWEEALKKFPGKLSLSDIFVPAIKLASDGFEVTETLHNAMVKLKEEYPNHDFASVFLNEGEPHKMGDTLTLKALAATYRKLAENGLSDWTTGELAHENATYLAKQGSPILFEDLEDTVAKWCEPLSCNTQWGKFYNFGAPTQGGASLNIIALLDKFVLDAKKPKEYWQTDEGEEQVLHLLVEAVKVAFNWRNENLCDSPECSQEMQDRLSEDSISKQFSSITEQATEWPNPGPTGDTVWMGVVDSDGLAVSYIQSIYWEFGSGVVNPETGVVWNNRCLGFHTDPEHPNHLAPMHQPMHTLNPPIALLNSGDRLLYGTMGGEGQPQTQAAIIWRYLVQKKALAASIAEPRWLLGKTWGKSSEDLKLEAPLFNKHGEKMKERGHDVVSAPQYAEFFGHAGGIYIDSNSSTAASDPRSDGEAIILKS
ncbi:gamma-glutamyltransferase [Vibrio hannami]|uniref:gamma-glutamyltransferase family protein n=1 Tax=Vibrio hannami TaxID=2717094 RepID=UPI00240EE0C3|nr:gamma-glutamyltransferase [Vibrio hannami]MDG3085256.1 gamma-glutamyltransferase [Vibrio hannami]